MAEFVYDCPHCYTKSVGFRGHGSEGRELSWSAYRWNTLFVCRRCRNGIVVILVNNSSSLDPMDVDGVPTHYGFELEAVYPAPIIPSAPEHVPEPLARNYVEAFENLQSGRWDSAGVMFGRTLEMATKDLAPGTERDSLKKRIDRLVNNGTMDPTIGDLADCIRDERNAVVHEEEFDKESAEQLHEFTHLFLTYTYSLPGRVKDAKTKRKGKKTP